MRFGRESTPRGRRWPLMLIAALTVVIVYQGTQCGVQPEAEDRNVIHTVGAAPSPQSNAEPSLPVSAEPRAPRKPSMPPTALGDDRNADIAPRLHRALHKARRGTWKPLSMRKAGGDEEDSHLFPALPTPPFSGLNLTLANHWLSHQKENELRRMSGILRELMELQQKERVHQRETAGRASKRTTTPPAINCRCYGLSAMDQRKHWCAQENGDTSKLSSAHVCIVENVCLDRGGRLIFVSNASQPDIYTSRREFLISMSNGVKLPATVVFRPSGDAESRRNMTASRYALLYSNATLFDASVRYDRGGSSPSTGAPPPYATLAVLSHSAASHITHFLEPIGSLQVAVRDHMIADSSSGPLCPPEDLTCFYKPTLTVSNMAVLDSENLWGQHVLRAVYQDYGRKLAFKKLDQLKWGEEEPAQCFRKAVIPGTFYGIWPEGADTQTFHNQLTEYLSRHDGPRNSTVSVPPLRREPFIEGVKRRRIVFAHRTSKRTVVDHLDLMEVIRRHAATVGATVEIVSFGSLSFFEQARMVADAGILMGIHGADLTNMVFMPRGGVVVELNPFFFFENRFRELAHALGLAYMPWNCGTHLCAFGGNSRHFQGYMTAHSKGGLTYNYSDYSLSTAAHPEPFEWNWKGYVGFSCRACVKMISQTGIKRGFYSELRESNIRFGPAHGKHVSEILSVLDDCFRHLKW